MTTSRFFTFAAATLLCTATAAAQAPANDDCASAAAVTVGLTNFDSTLATDGAGLALDALVCDMGPFGDEQIYQDLWYTFVAPATDNFDIAAINNGGTSYDSRIAIYNQVGCPDNPANVIDCGDDTSPVDLQASMQDVPLVMGTSYIIRVGSFSAATTEQPAALSITQDTPPPVPANDDCANAAVAMLGLTNFDAFSATDGTGLPLNPAVCDMGLFGDEQIYDDVWYTFVPATTDFYDIAAVNNGAASYDSRIAIYDQVGCPDVPASVIGCDEDAGPLLEALIESVSLTGGTSYLIRVGSYDATIPEEPAALSITIGSLPPTPPANDDCANAIALTAFGTYAYDNILATTDGADLAGFCNISAFGDDIVHNDVWFEYTPTVGGCTYISTLGLAGYDTRIAVYSSNACPDDPASVIACSDEELQPIAAPLEAGLDVTLSAGVPYLIRVGNYDTVFTTALSGAMFTIAAGPIAAGNDGGMQPGSMGCTVAPPFAVFCTGDGGDLMGCTDCPCSNNALAGTGGGCLHSGGTGSRLIASGDTSVTLPAASVDDLRFEIVDGAASQLYILNSGDALAPADPMNPCFGSGSGVGGTVFDGLRCAIMNTLRNGGRGADANGEVGNSNPGWGGADNPPAGIAQFFGYMAGTTKFFQTIHRDSTGVNCGTGLNTSQAIRVNFTP